MVIALSFFIVMTALVLLMAGQGLLVSFLVAAITPSVLVLLLWGDELLREFLDLNGRSTTTSTSETAERSDDHSQRQ